jgi:hypothetical protein
MPASRKRVLRPFGLSVHAGHFFAVTPSFVVRGLSCTTCTAIAWAFSNVPPASRYAVMPVPVRPAAERKRGVLPPSRMSAASI